MGKSNRPLDFGKSAGPKLMVIRLAGNLNLEFIIALRTLSLLSFTSAEASPTIDIQGNPFDRCTSTVTKGALIPKQARL